MCEKMDRGLNWRVGRAWQTNHSLGWASMTKLFSDKCIFMPPTLKKLKGHIALGFSPRPSP